MQALSKIVVLLLLAGTKFAIASPAIKLAGFGYWESITILLAGGWLGVLAFYYIGGMILLFLEKLFEPIFRGSRRLFGWKEPKAPRTVTKKNRIIVGTKNRFGVIGISLLTPVLLSIPIGTIIMSKYYRSNKRTVLYLFLSVVFWAFVLNTLIFQFDVTF